MPLHAYRTFVGLAADRVNATLTSTIALGAVSLPLSNTVGTTGTLSTSGASYSAIIVDGTSTEVVACSGSLTAGAIACGATANAHNANVYVFFQLTASIGPTAYIPLDALAPADAYTQLLDQTYRGSAVKTVGIAQGLRNSSWTLGGPVYPDTIGYLLGGLWGAEDYTAGSPNQHKFATLNGTGGGTPSPYWGQPVPYALYLFDGFNCRVYAGGKFNEVQLTYDPGKLIMHATKFMARASGVVATPTPSFSAIPVFPSWNGSATIAGSGNQRLESFDVTFTRQESEFIETLQGIQDPYAVWLGAMETKGKAVAVKEDDTLYADWTAISQPSLTLAATSGTGASQVGLNVQMTKCNFDDVKIVPKGKAHVYEEITFEAVSNATDANTAGGGLSPGQVLLKNAVASGTTYT